MVQVVPQLLTFDQFVAWYPDGRGRYELHEGIIFEMNPTGDHEEVGAFLNRKLNVELERKNLPYFIPRTYLVKPPNTASGYQPDVIVLDKDALQDEPLWKKSSTISQGKSVKLVVEIVSTNWRDDYLTKARDYEEIGIPEYWIVDYLGLGGKRFIGNPKQPTFFVYQLVEGEYQVSQFRGDEPIQSPTFPELNLTAQHIFSAGE